LIKTNEDNDDESVHIENMLDENQDEEDNESILRTNELYHSMLKKDN
jgi:hypothetical protein